MSRKMLIIGIVILIIVLGFSNDAIASPILKSPMKTRVSNDIPAGTNYGWINGTPILTDNVNFVWVNGRPYIIFNATTTAATQDAIFMNGD